MPELYKIIERPLITEKALGLNGERKYAFVVNKNANKIQIRNAVQTLFTDGETGGVIKVTDVNTFNIAGKSKRFRAFGRLTMGKSAAKKKAIVTLAEGQSITIFEGV